MSRVLADYLGVIYEEAAARFERAQFSLYPTLSSAEDAGGCGWQHWRPCLTCSRNFRLRELPGPWPLAQLRCKARRAGKIRSDAGSVVMIGESFNNILSVGNSGICDKSVRVLDRPAVIEEARGRELLESIALTLGDTRTPESHLRAVR